MKLAARGYLLLVLNTHMPDVRNPEIDHPVEEAWLYEAITECYLPLLEVLCGLVDHGADFKITLSITPCLIDMLNDPLIKARYLTYLEDRIRLAEKEVERLQHQPEFLRVAHWYLEEFQKRLRMFIDQFGGELIDVLRQLSDSGKVDILASAGTHAYLPMWQSYPKIVELQVKIGIQKYQAAFGKKPLGFWLPECAYYSGLDEILRREGVKYIFLESHGLRNGHPRPKYDVYAPVHSPSQLAIFGRDGFTHNQVWSKNIGYPGDPNYLDFDRDVGYELDPGYLSTFTHQRNRSPTGIKYFRLNGWVYDPDTAYQRCDLHAGDFLQKSIAQITNLYAQYGKRPVLVAMFDSEHFGHWWREGPTWLNLAIRKLAYDQNTVRFVTGADYLRLYATNQVVTPSPSSWGYQGYHEVWLIGKNHWIYPRTFTAIEALDRLLMSNPFPKGLVKVALNQYLRELIQAQTSDWAYILHTGTYKDYAADRVTGHLQNMETISHQLVNNRIDEGWLTKIRNRNHIFSEMDLLDLYQKTGLHARR